MIRTIGRFNWKRVGTYRGAVIDSWWCKDYGLAVKTALGWYAGNGSVRVIADLTDEPDMIEPRVGPFASVDEAIQAYDAALDAWTLERSSRAQ